MKVKVRNKQSDCLVIDDKSLKKSEQTMRNTWADFREAIARKDFEFDDTDSALKVVFLKQFNDWFQGIAKQEMSKSFSACFKNKLAGRGTVIKPCESSDTPNYDRFMPKAEFIKGDNRFSPAGVEWLYLAIGTSEKIIKECAEKECRAKAGERFGFCEFKLAEDARDLKLVDLTIANNMTYDKINNELRKVYEDAHKKAMKLVNKYGNSLYGHYKYNELLNNEEAKPDIAKWILFMYAKMLSENIFVPIENDDKKIIYAPFQTLAMYFIKEGFNGIVYSSTVCPTAKNVVLFDKKYAMPYGKVADYIISE